MGHGQQHGQHFTTRTASRGRRFQREGGQADEETERGRETHAARTTGLCVSKDFLFRVKVSSVYLWRSEKRRGGGGLREKNEIHFGRWMGRIGES